MKILHVALCGTAVVAASSSARAEVPVVTVQINASVDGRPVYASETIELPVVFNSGTTTLFSAANLPQLNDQSFFAIDGTVAVEDDIYVTGKNLGPSMAFFNTSTDDLQFEMALTWPTVWGGGTYWVSTVSWHLILPGTLFTLPGQSMWTVEFDDTVIGHQFDDPSGMGGGGSGDLVLTTDPINGETGPVFGTMAAKVRFSLTAGGAADFDGAILAIPCVSCPGDLDCDGFIGVTDLLFMLDLFGPCGACAADIDEDGDVDSVDLLAFLSSWGECG